MSTALHGKPIGIVRPRPEPNPRMRQNRNFAYHSLDPGQDHCVYRPGADSSFGTGGSSSELLSGTNGESHPTAG